MSNDTGSRIDRRSFIAAGTAGIAAAAILRPQNASGAGVMVGVEIENGKLRGTRENGAVKFKGVNYAANTGGANRFMAPQPVENWTGVRDALGYGNRCPQIRNIAPARSAGILL